MVSQRPLFEPDDWRADLEAWDEQRLDDWAERAAIMEYDGLMDRETAERLAWELMR